MKHLCKFLILTPLLFAFGCATIPQQTNITFQEGFLETNTQKIGVYVSATPEVKGHITGAGCLLCLATASTINAGLDKHMKAQSNEDLNDLKSTLISNLNEKGANVVEIDQIDIAKLPKNSGAQLNFSKKNFVSVGTDNGVDHVLVVQLGTLGTIRNFANYVPVGDPYAVFNALMYMVDTTTNEYLFYEPINITQYSETPWKEEGYPGITNAYYTAIERGKEQILDLKATVAPTVTPIEEQPKEQAQNSDSESTPTEENAG